MPAYIQLDHIYGLEGVDLNMPKTTHTEDFTIIGIPSSSSSPWPSTSSSDEETDSDRDLPSTSKTSTLLPPITSLVVTLGDVNGFLRGSLSRPREDSIDSIEIAKESAMGGSIPIKRRCLWVA